MAYQNPSTFVAGNVLTAAQQNVLANNDRFLHGVPRVRVQGAAATTVATGTNVAVIFGTEVFDNDSMWSSTAPTIININTAGTYLVGGQVQFSESTAGTFRGTKLQLNSGTTFFHQEQMVPPESGHLQMRFAVGPSLYTFTSTQFIRLIVDHDAGVTLTIAKTTSVLSPNFWAVWQSS